MEEHSGVKAVASRLGYAVPVRTPVRSPAHKPFRKFQESSVMKSKELCSPRGAASPDCGCWMLRGRRGGRQGRAGSLMAPMIAVLLGPIRVELMPSWVSGAMDSRERGPAQGWEQCWKSQGKCSHTHALSQARGVEGNPRGGGETEVQPLGG